MAPLVLSARSEEALREQASQWAQWMENHPQHAWNDILQTAALSRSTYPVRAAVAATNAQEAAQALEALGAGATHALATSVMHARPGKLGFLFTGQGSQMAGMGKALCEAIPLFGQAVDMLCQEWTSTGQRCFCWRTLKSEAKLLGETAYTQPALFVFEAAMATLWQFWGVKPDYLLGHSIGELVAAYTAGVLSLPDAAKLVCARGRLMQGCQSGGAMASIAATESDVRSVMADSAQVSIAGLNGPNQTVVSGDADAVSSLMSHFEQAGKRVVPLKVSHAFHSPHMDAMLEDFLAIAQTCRFRKPKIPIVSNLTGKLATDEEITSPQYWVVHVRGAVRFVDGMQAMAATGVTTLIEVGPRGVLCGMGANCVGPEDMAFIPSHRKLDHEIPTGEGLGCVRKWPFMPWAKLFEESASSSPIANLCVSVRATGLKHPAAEWREHEHRKRPLAGQELSLPGGGTLHLLEIGPEFKGTLVITLFTTRWLYRVRFTWAFFLPLALIVGPSRRSRSAIYNSSSVDL